MQAFEAAIAMALLMLVLCPMAEAATAFVQQTPRVFNRFLLPGEEVVYVAAPGERNRVVVRTAHGTTGLPWTLSDAGAVIEPGPGCVAVDAHTVQCTSSRAYAGGWGGLLIAGVQLGDLDDSLEFLEPDTNGWFLLFANGDAGNDRMSGATGGGELLGGAGDDRLFSNTDPYEVAALDGGGGRDELHGGLGMDRLSDGDVDGASGEAGVGPDVLTGGGGEDTISYQYRSSPVSVDVADRGPDGAPGEGDLVRSMESIVGGRGDDRLAGDDGPNQLDGRGGRDVLIGRGDYDLFSNGGGPISRGPGDDLILLSWSTDLLAPDCENVSRTRPYGSGLSTSAHPTLGRDGLPRYRIPCPGDPDTGEDYPCAGSVELTRAGAGRQRLAYGTFSSESGRARRVILKITRLGHRLAATRRGTPAIVTVTRDGAKTRWGIRLRLPPRAQSKRSMRTASSRRATTADVAGPSTVGVAGFGRLAQGHPSAGRRNALPTP